MPKVTLEGIELDTDEVRCVVISEYEPSGCVVVMRNNDHYPMTTCLDDVIDILAEETKE